MIEVCRRQLNFGEGLIAEEVGELWEDWMRQVDEVLSDQELLSTVYEALARRWPKSRTRGRKGTPAEVVLRLLLLKHIRNWSYAILEREVRANLVYRQFTRVGAQKVPDAKTLGNPDISGLVVLAPSGGTGGTSGSGSDGGSGAGNGSGGGRGPTTGDEPGGTDFVSIYCGDGVRDTTAGSHEECDDGLGTEPDLCTDRCQVNDALASGVAGGVKRYLGAGRHPLAAGSHGFAVTFVEPDAEPTIIGLSVFDAIGDPRSRIAVSAGSNPVLSANPTVAALDDGSYAVVWTDFGRDGDGLGVALRRVLPVAGTGALPPQSGAALGATLSPLEFANATRSFSQYDADTVLAGDRLVVAWTDTSDAVTGPDIRYREFSVPASATRRFTPLGEELTLSSKMGFEGNVALAALGDGWAAAYRSNQGDAEETIEVVVPDDGGAWSIGPDLAGGPDDRPAIAELDPDHLLVLFTVGTDPGETGVASAFRLRAAVIDRAAAEPLEIVDLPPLDAAYQSPDVSQSHPSLVRAGDELYAAFRVSTLAGQAEAENVFLQRLTWDGELSAVSEYRIPRWPAGSLGDQRFPALAVGPRQLGTPGLPEPAFLGALVIAWDDYGREHGASQGQPDVLVQHWPLPIVRLDAPRPSDCSTANPCGLGEGHCENDAECAAGLVCVPNAGLEFGLPPSVSVCAPGPWSPARVSPVAWFVASSSDVTLSNGNVSQWSDRSGNGRHVTNDNIYGRPTYNATGWNGANPTVTFNGGNLLRRLSWGGPGAGTDQSFSVLGVIRSTATGAHNGSVVAWWVEGGANPSSVRCNVLTSGGNSFVNVAREDVSSGAQSFSSTSDIGNGRHAVAWRFAPEVMKVTVDGTTYTSSTQTSLGTVTLDMFIVGARTDLATWLFQGDISELVVVGSSVSDSDVEGFRSYAQSTWGGLP